MKEEDAGDPAWLPERYARHAAYVPALGAPLVEILAPRPGERILDLGCGDGSLTVRLAERGASVVAVDRSPEMVAAARARGLDARLGDATALLFAAEFDGVFSNAVLHWVRDHDAMLAGVARALRPGGRLVAEFGGHGNVAAIVRAMREALERHGYPFSSPWFYPTAEAYRGRLAAAGFIVDHLELFARPTPLPTGMAGWLETFAGPILSVAPDTCRAELMDEIATSLRPVLFDETRGWTADYVRLRLAAHLAPPR
jgi:trans-aconitate methyltransferase